MLLVAFLASNQADTDVAVKWPHQPTAGGQAVKHVVVTDLTKIQIFKKSINKSSDFFFWPRNNTNIITVYAGQSFK